MEVGKAVAPAGKLAKDQRRPPLREDLGGLRHRTELAISLHAPKSVSPAPKCKSITCTAWVHKSD